VLFRCLRKGLTKAEDGKANLAFEKENVADKREKR
jgi:hypothetical protein